MVDDDLLIRLGISVSVVFLALTSVSFYAMIALRISVEAWLSLVTGGMIVGLLIVDASVAVATLRKVFSEAFTADSRAER